MQEPAFDNRDLYEETTENREKKGVKEISKKNAKD